MKVYLILKQKGEHLQELIMLMLLLLHVFMFLSLSVRLCVVVLQGQSSMSGQKVHSEYQEHFFLECRFLVPFLNATSNLTLSTFYGLELRLETPPSSSPCASFKLFPFLFTPQSAQLHQLISNANSEGSWDLMSHPNYFNASH